MQQPDSRNFLEKKFHLPPLGDLKQNLDAVNTLVQSLDKQKFNQAITLLNLIYKIQCASKPGELERVERIIVAILRLTCDVKIEQVVSDVKCTVVAVRDLVKMMPPDMLKGVKVGDLIKEVKESK